MNKHFFVRPQAQVRGLGWVLCPPHKAKRWAVVSGRTHKMVKSFPTKALAEAEADRCERAAEGPTRRYKLGKRMGLRSAGTYNGEKQ